MAPQEGWAALRERYPDVFICFVPVYEFSLAENLTMHAAQSSGRAIQPARSFCDTSITARTAGNEIAPNPPFAVGHYFLHLHYHRSQIGSGYMLRPLLCLSVPCSAPFQSGNLNLGRDARNALDLRWIRAWAFVPSYLRTFYISRHYSKRPLNGPNIPIVR
jgi:hypothetical protein